MKKFLLVSIFILAFCAFNFAQTNQTVSCPKIEISRSDYFRKGEEIVLTVNVQNYDWNKLNYIWKLSNNISIKEQGSPVIYFTATEEMNGLNVIATVEISGLPENCNKIASEKFQIVYPVGTPIVVTEYEKLSFSKEKVHLDLVYFELKKDSNASAIFIISFTKKDSISAIKNRVQKIKNFLIAIRQIPRAYSK